VRRFSLSAPKGGWFGMNIKWRVLPSSEEKRKLRASMLPFVELGVSSLFNIPLRRHFQTSWETLLDMFGSTAILPPRTKRWAEAKVIADCVSVKVMRQPRDILSSAF